MKTTSHLKSTITLSMRGAISCPPLGRVFLFAPHLLACVALAPVAQANLHAAGCVGDACRELQFHRQLEQRAISQPVITWTCPRAVRLYLRPRLSKPECWQCDQSQCYRPKPKHGVLLSRTRILGCEDRRIIFQHRTCDHA